MIRRVAVELFLLGFVIYFGADYFNTIRNYDPLESMGIETISQGGQTGAEPTASFVPTEARDIAEKNPFHPERGTPRPAVKPLDVPTPAEVEPPPPPPVPVELKGIILGDDGERIAVVTEGQQRARLMREGDTVGTVTILTIEADRVTIRRPMGDEVLNLRELRTIDLEDDKSHK